jgi:hypothetical protein
MSKTQEKAVAVPTPAPAAVESKPTIFVPSDAMLLSTVVSRGGAKVPLSLTSEQVEFLKNHTSFAISGENTFKLFNIEPVRRKSGVWRLNKKRMVECLRSNGLKHEVRLADKTERVIFAVLVKKQ